MKDKRKTKEKREETTMRNSRLVLCATIMLLISGAASAQQDYINIFAGGGPNNVPALQANLDYPATTATDSAGNYYIVDPSQYRVFKVDSTGTLTVLAGSGFYGYSGDGGPATQADLYLGTQSQVAVDSSGNVYIADTSNCVIREVTKSTGIISTFAGTPQVCSYGGDGSSATAPGTYLYYPFGVAVDSAGNVFIADTYNYRIRVVIPLGKIFTVAGNGTFCSGSTSQAPCGDGGAATSANLGTIYSLAVDGAGNVFLDDNYPYNATVRMFTPGDGNINAVAGSYYYLNGNIYYCSQYGGVSCGDGGPATSAFFYYPYGIASDSSGNLFIADFNNYDIREVVCADSAATCTARAGTTAGDIYTVAGTGGSYGDSGDGGASTSATLGYAYGSISVDSSDNMFIPNYSYLVVRKAALGGNINTVAGNGTINFTGNNIQAADAVLNNPWGVAFDSSGNAYIADIYNQIVRKVDTSGVITVFAGTVGVCGSGGDGGPATSATLCSPQAVATDSSGNVYIVDSSNYKIRMVDSGGNISTFAGGGSYNPPSQGDGGAATSAYLYYPQAVAVGSNGNVYIADYYDCRIRVVSGGTINNFAGTQGACAYAGDGGLATSAQLAYPRGVAVDKSGNVYASDTSNLRVRRINPAGIIDTFAGNGAGGFEGDGGPANETSLYYPEQIAVDPAGDVIISDLDNQRIRLVDGQGLIHTVAGDGNAGYSGPEINVLATTAELYDPYGVGVDAAGNIYIGDTANNLVRKVNAVAVLNASRTNLVFNVQPVGKASGAQSLTLTSSGPLTITAPITTTGPFTQTNNCGSGPPTGGNCVMDVTFTPTSSGTFAGTITIPDNGFFNTSLVIDLTGYGTAVAVAPTSLAFSATAVGVNSAAKTVTLTNNGPNPLTVNSPSTTGDFAVSSTTCTGNLNPKGPGDSCTYSVVFKPTTYGARTGSLVINDSDGSSPQLVSLSGTGLAATLAPSTTTFAAQGEGTTSAAKTITLTNHIAAPITGISASTTGANAGDFTITGGTCGATLASGSCTFTVTFKPSTAGAETAALSVAESPDGAITAALKGTGAAALLSPNPESFGTVTDGTTSANKTITLNNYSGSPITSVSAGAISGANAGDFTITGGTCTSLPSGTLSGASCTYTVTFTPSADGTESATLSVNDSAGTQTTALSGIGNEVSLSPTTLAFGTQTSPTNKSVTVTNNGPTQLTFGAPTITGTGATYYTVVAYDGTNSTCLGPTPVANPCTITVTFTPPGTATNEAATLHIYDNGAGPTSSQTVPLSGK